jgi:hypothetical protein
MAKQIKPGMLRFAKDIGAIKNGKPDWYLVAELLARIAVPELLEETPAAPLPGRPKLADNDFLAMEIRRVMATSACGEREACRRIARGDLVRSPVSLWRGPGDRVTVYTKGSPWKGQNPLTLEGRYARWKRAEKAREARMRITIPAE